MALYVENFSLYTYILMHDKLFLYTHWNSFSLRHTVYIQTLFTFNDFFFRFFPTHTCGSYKSFFIYTRCSHTQGFIFTHYLHTQKILLYTFSFYIHIWETFFFFFICVDIYSQRFFLFIMILVHFIFILDNVPKNEKFYTIPELQQTLLITTK